MKKKTSFMDFNNDVFASSMKKIDWSIFLILLLDIAFYASVFFLFSLWFTRINSAVNNFQMPNDPVSIGKDGLEKLTSGARALYITMILSFVLLLAAIIFLASIFKGIIWAMTTKTKISLNLISKFLILNLIWMGFWFLIFFLILKMVEPHLVYPLALASLAIALYLTNTIYTIFMKSRSLKSMIQAIRLNVMKIHYFAIPYASFLLLIFIVLQIGAIVKTAYWPAINLLIILSLTAVFRHYVSTLVSRLAAK